MMTFKTIQERIALHRGFDEYIQSVAQAYVKAPEFDASAVSHWKALAAADARLGQQLLSKIKVEWVIGQPYSNYQELKDDVTKNHHLSVSEDYANHPVWTRDENLQFRAVHDYYTHVLGNHPFGGRGEIAAYNLSLKLYPREAIPALFTEVVGQASVAVVSGNFPVQKIVLLPQFDYYNLGIQTS